MQFFRISITLNFSYDSNSFGFFLDLIRRRVLPENDFSPKHRSVAGLCIGGASFCQAEGRRVENRGNFRATKLSEVSANCICIYQADLLKKSIARKRNFHIIMRIQGFTWDNKYDNGVSRNFTCYIILRTLFKIATCSKYIFLHAIEQILYARYSTRRYKGKSNFLSLDNIRKSLTFYRLQIRYCCPLYGWRNAKSWKWLRDCHEHPTEEQRINQATWPRHQHKRELPDAPGAGNKILLIKRM